jgi:hypothetical protein
MAAPWDEIRAYLAGREDEEADEEADEDEGEDEEEDEDEEDKGEEDEDEEEDEKTGGTHPYRDGLRALGDAAPPTVKALALGNPAMRVAGWLDSLHRRAEQPGSVLPLVFVLVFLIFAMVPVNGSATRLELIWRALTGGAALPPSATELALAAQYQELAAERRIDNAIGSAVWGPVWGVAGTLIP